MPSREFLSWGLESEKRKEERRRHNLPSIISVFAAIGVIIVILIAGIVGFLFLLPNHYGEEGPRGGSVSTNSSSSSSSSSVSVSTSSSEESTLSSSSSSSTSSSHSATTSSGKNYMLKLVDQGATSPAFSSSLTTNQGKTRIQCDEPYCYSYYLDNGNNWTLDGDIEPGQGFFLANDSGLTLINPTCNPTPTNNIEVCGPWHEAVGDKWEDETVSQVTASLSGLPPDLTLFSIYLTLPDYSQMFSHCIFNQSSAYGCSYEGYSAAVIGVFALTVNNTNTIAINAAETGSEGNPTTLSFSAQAAGLINGKIVTETLNSTNAPSFTPSHKFTIATDRKSFIELFVDNTKLYSSESLPIDLGGSSISISFYQFTSVNNETITTTWKNFTAYDSSAISVTGLQSGMSVFLEGQNGFSESVVANSSGIAVLDVSLDPLDLRISVELGGQTIATYEGTVGAGAQLELLTI